MPDYQMPDGQYYSFKDDADASAALDAWEKQFGATAKLPADFAAQYARSPTPKAPGLSATDIAASAAFALPEFVLSQGSAAIETPIAGLKGLYNLAAGEGLDKSAEAVKSTLEAGIYEPRTAGGKMLNTMAAAPFVALGEAGKRVGGAIGEQLGNRDLGESIGEVAPVMGLTAASGIPAVKGAKATGKSLAESNAARMQQLYEQRQLNKVADATRKRLHDAGFKTPAEEGPEAIVSGFGRGINKALSIANRDWATRKAADQMGVQALSETALSAVADKAITKYDNLVKAAESTSSGHLRVTRNGNAPEWAMPGVTQEPGMATPPATQKVLMGLAKELKDKIEYDPSTFGSLRGAYDVISQQANRKFHDPKMAMEQIKQLRRDASATFKNNSATPLDLETAVAKKSVATMLEDVIEAHLAGKPKLLEEFRDARTKLAQLDLIERSVNQATGKLDIQKFTNLSKNAKLTGDIALIRDAGQMFPQATARATGAAESLTIMDAMFAAAAISAGHPLFALGELGGRVGAPALARAGFLQSTPKYTIGKLPKAGEIAFNRPLGKLFSGAQQ